MNDKERRDRPALLGQSEESLRLTVEASGLGIFDWDLATGRVVTNARFREMLGLPGHGEISAATMLADVVHPDDRALVHARISAARDPRTNGRYQFEHRAVTPHGERWLLTFGQVHFAGEGDSRRAVRVLGNDLDITERKHAEEAMRASEWRQTFLLALSDALRPLADPVLVQETAARLLGEQLGADRAFYTEVESEPGGEHLVIAYDYHTPDTPSLVGRFPLTVVGRDIRDRAYAGETIVVADVDTEPSQTEEERAGHRRSRASAFVVVPLVKHGRLVAFLSVHQAVPRPWTRDQVALVEATAERTWAAVERARAEAALRETEARLRALFAASERKAAELHAVLDSMNDAVYIGGLDGITLANQPALDQLGYATQEELQRHVATLAEEIQTRDWETGVTIPAEHQAFARALRGERVVQNVRVRHRLSGEERVVRSAAAPVVIDGQVIAAVAVNTDITEQKRAERALRENEERLRLAIAATGLSLYDWDLTTDRLTVNARYRELAGLSESDPLVGRAVLDELVHPDDRALVNMRLSQARDPGSNGTFQFEHRIAPPQGVRWLLTFGQVYFAGEGNDRRPTRLIGNALDITARREAEEAVRTSLDRQAFLLKLSDAIRPLADPEEVKTAASRVLGEHLAANRVIYTEVDRRGWIVAGQYSRKLDALPPGHYPAQVYGQQVMAAFRAGRRLVFHDARIDPVFSPSERKALGLLAVVGGAGVPLVKRGRLVAALTLHTAQPHDWTDHELGLIEETAERTWEAVERARAEAALARAHESEMALRAAADQANRAKDEFLAMLGHELRNPLTPILTALELMRAGNDRTFTSERQIIERQARHMARLVDDLLDVTRIVRGKVTLQKKRCQVSALIERAVELVAPLLEEKRHRLDVHVSAPAVVEGDPTRLVQVIANLITNAAKYTNARGHIHLHVEKARGPAPGSWVVLRVRDDGRGIGADLLPHVFERFWQGPQSSERSQGGLGLGLAIVRSLVELHGGSVAATSEGPGRGSEFTVRLPAAKAPGKSAPRERADPSRPARTGRARRILIVDDNRDIADVLAQLLRKRGHEVDVAYTATRGLETARRFHPDIALLDIGLPEMDGYELARRFRKDKVLAPVKLLAVTGYGQADDRKRALRAGFSGHLVKPVDLPTLNAALEGVSRRPRSTEKPRAAAPGRRP